MSKIREQLTYAESDLPFESEGDLEPYVIFTQLKQGGPYIYAGWVDAADSEMALLLAKEHYGQDQECTNIWAIRRHFVAGLRMNLEASREEVPEREYQLFTQKEAGDQHFSGPIVRATSAQHALQAASGEVADHGSYHSVWAVPMVEIASTEPGEMIWRETDQSYRLARGYSKDVREKWEQIREERALREYEKDDLTETF